MISLKDWMMKYEADIEKTAEERLRAFYDAMMHQAEIIASAAFECAETMGETLAPLIDAAADVLRELLPLTLEEIRCTEGCRPKKKDAPRKIGQTHIAMMSRKNMPKARSRI